MGKLGLVLSGGVSKGAYELGVIRAMAERGIEPDVIVGISAGAMSGAMMTGLMLGGNFCPERVDDFMIRTWTERVNLRGFYHSFDGEDGPGDLERKSLNNLFLRFGIDPFERIFIPTRFDSRSIGTLETILRGQFVSLFSHSLFRKLAQEWNFPTSNARSVKFSAAICNLLGQTTLRPEDETIERAWAHFEDFHWYPGLAPSQNFIQFNRMLDVVMASSSFPLAFPPMRMTLPGASQPGMFIDGGMTDHAPIGKVIKLDPEVDTVLVVMATTIVPPPEQDPDDIVKVFNRMAEMLAGKFIINNYHQVQKVNKRIQALHRLFQRDGEGEVLRNEFNQDLAVAAGFENLDAFLARRVVRLIPIIPSAPLKGDLFAGFKDRTLMLDYIERGLQDARVILDQRLVSNREAPA
ncbi:MAG: patatin-like phospholipase family protein [Candidatus Sericytochromatia bacterium]|nr:patatin-like phospholipase family protein [Candidatus Sericytochromatia bacterium]